MDTFNERRDSSTPDPDKRKAKAGKKKSAGESHDAVDLREPQFIGGARIPPLYEVWRNGVFKLKQPQHRVETEEDPPQPDHTQKCPRFWKQNLELVIEQPMAIVGCGMVVDAEEALTELWFRANGSEHRKWVDRLDLARSSTTIGLASHGLVVDETNARKVVEYLRKCLVANETTLEQGQFVRRIGFHDRGGATGWLVGSAWIGCGGRLSAAPTELNVLSFAYEQSGEFEDWTAFVGPLAQKYSGVRFTLGSYAGSVLVRHLRWRPPAVHEFGETGSGKTARHQLGVSMWGNPAALTTSLNNTTDIAITEVFNYLDDLPTLFDEEQGAKVDLSAVIYRHGSGQGRSRSTRTGGLQGKRVQWHSIMHSTGEKPITGATAADLGGQESRCVQVAAEVMQEPDAKAIYGFLCAGNYGTAGPAFLETLLPVITDEARLGGLRAEHQRLRDHIAEELAAEFKSIPRSRLLNRAGHLAVVGLGEALFLSWVLGWERADAWQQAREDAVAVGKDSIDPDVFAPFKDRIVAFLQDHFTKEGHRYIDVTEPRGVEEAKDRRRMTEVVGLRTASEVLYIPAGIDKALKSQGWDPRRVWGDLTSAGIAEKDGRSNRPKRTIAAAGITARRFYVLRLAKLFPADE